jgi:uncharacterized protein
LEKKRPMGILLARFDEGRITGDRVLGVRFADTDVPDDVWSRKHGMLALINTPGLARLRVTFDAKTLPSGDHQ